MVVVILIQMILGLKATLSYSTEPQDRVSNATNAAKLLLKITVSSYNGLNLMEPVNTENLLILSRSLLGVSHKEPKRHRTRIYWTKSTSVFLQVEGQNSGIPRLSKSKLPWKEGAD